MKNPAMFSDIETVSTKKNAIVLSLGLCKVDLDVLSTFEELVENSLELFFTTGPQVDKGRHQSESTMEWWMKQGPEAQKVFNVPMADKINVEDFYTTPAVKDMYGSSFDMQACKWYFRGPHFDAAILETLFEDFALGTPFKYYNVRDIRTWLDCNDVAFKLDYPEGFIAHNAAHDAAFDAWMMLQIIHDQPLVKIGRAA